MFSELELINEVKKFSNGYIGDDCAVIQPSNESCVITKDLLIEDVHFRTDYFSPEDLAQKALHANLSDIASMGAQPKYILCGISIPKHRHQYAKSFLQAFSRTCHKERVLLIGGDTTSSISHLSISISAFGYCNKKKLKYRSGAQVDDYICIAGNLGYASVGLCQLEAATEVSRNIYTNSFLRPQAKIKEGCWLASQSCVHSMMDLSDGLYIDLLRLCRASNKGAHLDLDLLKSLISDEVSMKDILEGGEDYSLLFTINSNSIEEFKSKFKDLFDYQLKIVGRISKRKGIIFVENHKAVQVSIKPFAHFGELDEV